MSYSGLMPSMEAIQQAVREPLLQAPHDYREFALYIFERAREIDHERVVARKSAEQMMTNGSVSTPEIQE